MTEPNDGDPDQRPTSGAKPARGGFIGVYATSMDDDIRGLLEELDRAGVAITERFSSSESRRRLGARIGYAFVIAEDVTDRRKVSKTRERRRNIAKVEKLARELTTIMSERVVFAELWAALARTDKIPPGYREQPLFMQVIESLRILAEGARSVDPERVGSPSGAVERLFVELAKVYRSEFGIEPLSGVTTSYHDPRGLFVTFVQAARRIAREPISGMPLTGRSRLTGDEPLSAAALETGLAAVRRNSSGAD